MWYNPKITFESIIEKTVSDLKNVKFDMIVVRGLSGTIVGPTVAYLLGKPFAVVRKELDSSHSPHSVEGEVCGDYIIIDDFIDTGETINKIRSACKEGNCIGVYLYEPCKEGGFFATYWAEILGDLPILNFNLPFARRVV